MEAERPKALPRNFLAQSWVGFGYPLRALGVMRRHRLWKLAMAAVGINVLLLAALLTLSVWYVLPILQQIDGSLAASGASELWQSVATILRWLFWAFAIVVVLGLNGVALMLVGQAVASPFLDMLSERVETLVLGVEPEAFSVRRAIEGVLLAVADLLWGLFYYVVVQLLILILGLVPVLGTVPATALSFGFSALLLAQEFSGLPLARKLVSYRSRWLVVWENKWLAVGFGASAMAMLLVPLVNLVLLPVAAVAGTLLYCDLVAGGRLGDLVSPKLASGANAAVPPQNAE